MKFSVCSKVIFCVLFVDVIIFSIMTFLYIQTISNNLENQFESKGMAIIHAIRTSVQDGILKGDVTSIKSAIDPYSLIQGIEYIVVDDKNNNVVAHTMTPYYTSEIEKNPYNNKKLLVNHSTGLQSKDMIAKTIDYNGEETIDISYPFSHKFLGHIHVGLGIGKEKHSIIIPVLAKAMLLSGALTITGLLIIFLYMKRILKPISDIKNATTKLTADHTVEVKLKIDSHDEIGDLALSFQEMTSKLKNYSDDLKHKVEESSKELSIAQSMLANSAKLSAIGEMAGGIAHEINNPLTIILGHIERVEKLLDKQPLNVEELKKICEKAMIATQRIAKIVCGLKRISRDGSNDLNEQFLVGTIIDETVGICVEKFKKNNVDLRIAPIPSISLIGQPVQLSQVFLNMLNNSFDAIENLQEKWISIDVKEDQSLVYITFTDSGHGIPPEIREKLLTPFFTTKSVGKGTGLGLSISSKIIQEHGGKIELDHKFSNTRFVISLKKKKPQPHLEEKKYAT